MTVSNSYLKVTYCKYPCAAFTAKPRLRQKHGFSNQFRTRPIWFYCGWQPKKMQPALVKEMRLGQSVYHAVASYVIPQSKMNADHVNHTTSVRQWAGIGKLRDASTVAEPCSSLLCFIVHEDRLFSILEILTKMNL